MLRHKVGRLDTNFRNTLGKVAYQVPCHLRVQNIGLKTRDILALIPETQVQVIERCSGHDGTYAVKKEFNAISRKIARPVARRVDAAKAEFFTSDCPMAAEQIASVSDAAEPPKCSFSLKPQKRAGLWLAVMTMPPAAFPALTANEIAGVGVGESPKTTSKPFPANTSATRSANWSAKKRRSQPTTTFFLVRFGRLLFQCSAVACATRSTLAKVKSSAITARQPSVPNLIFWRLTF